MAGNAYTYRMPAGIPGDVNRLHEATIEPNLINASAPPLLYGIPVAIDASGVRPIVATDDTSKVAGVNVRPFPSSQINTTDGLGVSTPPISGEMDVLRRGYIMVKLNASSAAVIAEGQAYIWTDVTGAGHVQGGWEGAPTAGKTIAAPARFRGPADSDGNTELVFNL